MKKLIALVLLTTALFSFNANAYLTYYPNTYYWNAGGSNYACSPCYYGTRVCNFRNWYQTTGLYTGYVSNGYTWVPVTRYGTWWSYNWSTQRVSCWY